MGRFEFIASRFFIVSKVALSSPYIGRLRSISSYLLLLILSSVQLANAYRDTYNQGISYAAFIGSLLVIFKNLAFAEDKASIFDDSLQKDKHREIHGYRHLGLLSSIIKIPIRLERISTFFLATKGVAFAFNQRESVAWYVRPVYIILLLPVVIVLWITTISLNIIGLALIPLSALLLLIDILSIPFVETILVAFAENLPWIPELRGVIWGFVSLSLCVVAILSALCRDYLAWIAWLRDHRAFEIMDKHVHVVHPMQALHLIRALPSSHETALAAAMDLAETRNWCASDAAVHFSQVLAADDVKQDMCRLGIEFTSPKYAKVKFLLVKMDSKLKRRAPGKIGQNTVFDVWPPDIEAGGVEALAGDECSSGES